MKASALIIAATVASAGAFAPSQQTPRQSTQLYKSIFQVVSDMDLFAPKKDQNDYGARNKKKLGTGKLSDNSYVPAGLTKAQYEKIRAGEAKKKADNYQRNVNKAGVFQDYTEFYIKRGTDTANDWYKSVTGGHDMAKTKYDWSGQSNDAPLWAKEAGKGKGKGKK